MKVYIAAASTPDEIARAKRARAALTDAGIGVVSTWTDTVESGAGNPRDASRDRRRRWSMQDLSEVAKSDALWLLAPPAGATTRGAWVELGFAYARSLLIVISGDTAQSIFAALGAEYDTDDEALEGLKYLESRGAHL